MVKSPNEPVTPVFSSFCGLRLVHFAPFLFALTVCIRMIGIDEECMGTTKCGTWLYLSVQTFEGDR